MIIQPAPPSSTPTRGLPGNQMTNRVKTRLKRMQYRPGLIAGLTAKTRLDFNPT